MLFTFLVHIVRGRFRPLARVAIATLFARNHSSLNCIFNSIYFEIYRSSLTISTSENWKIIRSRLFCIFPQLFIGVPGLCREKYINSLQALSVLCCLSLRSRTDIICSRLLVNFGYAQVRSVSIGKYVMMFAIYDIENVVLLAIPLPDMTYGRIVFGKCEMRTKFQIQERECTKNGPTNLGPKLIVCLKMV